MVYSQHQDSGSKSRTKAVSKWERAGEKSLSPSPGSSCLWRWPGRAGWLTRASWGWEVATGHQGAPGSWGARSVCPLLPLLLPHSSPRDGHQSASPVEAWRLGEGLTSTHNSHVHRHNLRTLRKQSRGAYCVQLGFHHSAQWPRDPPRLQWHQQPIAFTAERCPWCGCDTACLPFTSEGHGVFSSLGLLKTLGTEFYGNVDVLFSR